MRISDWSSDVCSSDLPAPRARSALARNSSMTAGISRSSRARGMERAASPFTEYAWPSARMAEGATGAQIGRASCRERGCQYVYIAVVAVYVQTKKIYDREQSPHRT